MKRIKTQDRTEFTGSPYRELPLTQGAVALVDEPDFEWLSGYRWHSNGSYAYRKVGPRAARHTIAMHRLIAGASDGLEVDHVNGDGLDNRRHNLRLCRHTENVRNSRRRADNTSGFKGVSQRADTGKWTAYVNCGGVRAHLGCFANRADAARAYDAAARDLHGEFARLNFPDEVRS